MDVTELSDKELCELKERLVYGADWIPDMDSLTDYQRKEIEGAGSTDDISDDLVFRVYAGIDFVDDDFFCNAEEG